MYSQNKWNSETVIFETLISYFVLANDNYKVKNTAFNNEVRSVQVVSAPDLGW